MIILASQSQTRRALLTAAGIDFKAMPSPLDEEAAKSAFGAATASQLAQQLATAKALALSTNTTNALVIAADQTLECDGHILHKPANMEEARRQLLNLRAKIHRLHSAITLTRGTDILFTHLATATLRMRNFSDSFLERYLENVDPGVAKSLGGYQLENLGVQLFDGVDGDYFTILGLPLLPLLAYLRETGEIET